MGRSVSTVAYAVSLSCIIKSATAVLLLSDLQPISGFPRFCEATYNKPISVCPDATSFLDTSSTAGCDRTCFEALNTASLAIQSACRSAAAYGDTVISHAFDGDLSIFLCGNQFSQGSNTVTATNVAITAGTPINTGTSSSSPSTSSSVQSSQTTDSASPTSETATTSSTDMSSSSLSSSATTSSEQSTTITTMTKSSAPSSTTNAPRSSSTHFDSTPFDMGSSTSRGTPSSGLYLSGLASVTSCVMLWLTWMLVF